MDSRVAQTIQHQKLCDDTSSIGHDSESLGKLIDSIKGQGIETEVWTTGKSRETSDWSVRTLHPSAELTGVSDNASSLCLLFEFGGKRILLPGDLEPPGLQSLVNEPSVDVDLLMAPHHGSLNAKSRMLVDWCDPKL